MAGVYKYATIQELRDENITAAQLSDARALKLIERVSREINELTEQWFVPIARRLVENGSGGHLLTLGIPVLRASALELVTDRTVVQGVARVGAVEPDPVYGLPSELPRFDDSQAFGRPFGFLAIAPDFAVDGRRLRSTTGAFPSGSQNIRIDGVFGWVEDAQDFKTALAVPFAPGDAEATLEDASGVRVGHVLAFISGAGASARTLYIAWVKAVAGNVVTLVDAADDLAAELPIGTEASDFGAVPAGIERATVLLVNRAKDGIGSEEFSEEEFFGRLLSERTDNYEYRLREKPSVTGDDFVNGLLSQFVRPPFVGMV